MSDVVVTAENEPAEPTKSDRLKATWIAIEGWLERATSRANPILVKETRQALKSRQFVISFLVVLVGCWIVTLGGVAIIGPSIYFGAFGPEMLMAYFCVLAAPLAVIVPYSAYRSLAVEKEENTYDLLSITTLGSRQIITGKLCSAAVQTFVFFSAVAPCIAFTFLLRGIDAITVAFLLVIALLGSLGLSMVGLLVGTLAQARYTQVIISVALVLSLVGAFMSSIGLAVGLLEEGSMLYGDPEFWLIVLSLLTLYFTTFGLLHAAAAARISFPSENRATPLRRWMTIQQACFVAWLGGFVFYVWSLAGPGLGGFANDLTEVLIVFGVLGLIYWYVMGMLLTSEWPHLSRRVQRSLPQSTAGRVFLSWFNPGPGAGYVFAISNYAMLCIGAMALMLGWRATGAPGFRTWFAEAMYFFSISWCYLVIFLGLGRLVITLFRRFAFVPLVAGFLTQLILLLTGIGVPMLIYLMSPSSRYLGNYSLLQITNPPVTLYMLLDDGPNAIDAPTVLLVLGAVAAITLLVNARSVATELHRQRTAVPIRIVEEDAASVAVAPRKPQNPWEADEAAANQADGSGENGL